MRYDLAVILSSIALCVKRSTMAVTRTLSLMTSFHRLKARLAVTTVVFLSVRRERWLNSISAPCYLADAHSLAAMKQNNGVFPFMYSILWTRWCCFLLSTESGLNLSIGAFFNCCTWVPFQMLDATKWIKPAHYVDTHTLFDTIQRILDGIGHDYVINYSGGLNT